MQGNAGAREEGSELMEEEGEEGRLGRAGIAAQKVEHYEIAAYGTLVAWALLPGDQAVEFAELLGRRKSC